jgi:hypothetical protein
MFSNIRKPDQQSRELVAYVHNSFFSQNAATPESPCEEVQSNLIAFLSAARKSEVEFLPILWEARGFLGKGGSGAITQADATAETSLAFKHFHVYKESGEHFPPMISEVWILCQPPIRDHPNIITLEAICWEIDRNTQVAQPVLVFEKAPWDLQQFMNDGGGIGMSIDERLDICADIGNAIMSLHAYGW